MIRLAHLLIAVALAGCQPYTLEERWRPLEEVVERPALHASNTVSTTLGARIYVVDLGAWLKRFPPDSPEQEALLLHEREHAVRQLEAGLGSWLARYLNDRAFMWREEQVGWFLQLQRLRQAGRPVVPAVIAAVLADYRNLSGRMVDYGEALAWVQAVLSGAWTPENAHSPRARRPA